MCLPIFLVVLSGFLGAVHLITRYQKQVALAFRLEVCAFESAAERSLLLNRISQINRAMLPLQNTVYVSRGGSLIPGMAIAGEIGEAAALNALRGLSAAQKSLITAAGSWESLKLHCSQSPFSSTTAWCFWRPITLAAFEPIPALFPDIPPRLALDPKLAKTRFACMGRIGARILREESTVSGNPSLTIGKFTHARSHQEI